MNKSCALVLLLCASFFRSSAFLLVFILTPFQLDRRGLDPLHNGFIIAFAGIAYCLVSYFCSPCLYVRCGLSSSLSLSLTVHSAGLILLALAYYSNNSFFLTLTYLSRLVQGAGETLTTQVVDTTAKIVFYRSETRVAKILKISNSVAVVLGALLGGLLFAFIGYAGVFFVFGGAQILFLIFKSFLSFKPLVLKYQRRVKRDQQITEWETFSTESDHEKLRLSQICRALTANLLISLQALGLCAFLFLAPLLANTLASAIASDASEVSYFFALLLSASLLLSILLIFLPWKKAANYLTILACITAAIGSFLLTSHQLLSLTPSVALFSIALILLGSSSQLLLTLAPHLSLTFLSSLYPSRQAELSAHYYRLQFQIRGFSIFTFPLLSSILQDVSSSMVNCFFSCLFLLFGGFFLYSTLRSRGSSCVAPLKSAPLLS